MGDPPAEDVLLLGNGPFRTGNYRGNPLAAHARLVTLTDMGRDKFDRWLTLFKSTVDALFAGERADHIKSCATDMANVIYSRINQVPDPRKKTQKCKENERIVEKKKKDKERE